MKLNETETRKLLNLLQVRFSDNMHRHSDLQWSEIEERLRKNKDTLWSISEMEATGGEPDVVILNKESTDIIFYDCSVESPVGRRSLCYDDEALASRKENRPRHNAIEMAAEMGIEMISEGIYRDLQKIEKFDLKTSSWIKTPEAIRKLGGALFCDRRFDHVFTYHNGASSYYAARGFRGMIKI